MGKMGITVKFMGVLKPINYKDSQGLVVKFRKKYMNCRPHLGILRDLFYRLSTYLLIYK